MNSINAYPGTLNRGRSAADREAASSAAGFVDSIAAMLQGVQDFAERALKDELDGGQHMDEVAEVLDAISDAIGKARKAESKISE
jgi:hypothetical protein